ncbi:3-hydroxyacyl-CoA dehydrogenase family protein [Paenibacillus flagellatus]|uniref:3-hydroxybutyryl-CoA dehydrogenase n=1 Tax=Paenibacillus flagellatus TaxID=2211139 RepID=A0A2V5K6G2_9BACL|nr:3-hydroxyacyl-CoA dehydrogenase NAD-binding domain-containing protein [Paenibacillus flagellatus]PYI54868.1 3-hydroxybutyryl-CoA dehydrogenase [Paenibacillus flagellatus]
MQISKVGVIGAGTMGQGIAEMLASKGIDVLLLERSPDQLEHAWAMIEISLGKRLEKWDITEAEKKLILGKIHKTYAYEQLSDCEMIVETVTEHLETKKDVFRKLDAVLPDGTIIASNTSTLSLTELAGETKRPERVIGLHFLYPVGKVPLVEIVRGLRTSVETYETVRAFVEQTIQKKGIMVYESPGFVTTRLICTLINEALHTLSEGVASAEDIDTAMRIGYDFRYGPLEMADRFGLDAVLAAMDRMFREYGDLKYRPSFLLKQMVRAGHLGVKSGEGFFRYDKDGDRL